MLFLKADGTNLARIDAPKPSIWSSVAGIAKTTKVALGVFALGAACAITSVSFGAVPLIAGGIIALAGAGIYAYGKINQAIERKSYIKPIFKAPSKDFDFMYAVPQNRGGNPPQAPAKIVQAAKPVAPAPKALPKSNGKENISPLIFPNRPVTLGKKVSSTDTKKPLAQRQQILA